jgi:hypothetical protein
MEHLCTVSNTVNISTHESHGTLPVYDLGANGQGLVVNQGDERCPDRYVESIEAVVIHRSGNL